MSRKRDVRKKMKAIQERKRANSPLVDEAGRKIPVDPAVRRRVNAAMSLYDKHHGKLASDDAPVAKVMAFYYDQMSRERNREFLSAITAMCNEERVSVQTVAIMAYSGPRNVKVVTRYFNEAIRAGGRDVVGFDEDEIRYSRFVLDRVMRKFGTVRSVKKSDLSGLLIEAYTTLVREMGFCVVMPIDEMIDLAIRSNVLPAIQKMFLTPLLDDRWMRHGPRYNDFFSSLDPSAGSPTGRLSPIARDHRLFIGVTCSIVDETVNIDFMSFVWLQGPDRLPIPVGPTMMATAAHTSFDKDRPAGIQVMYDEVVVLPDIVTSSLLSERIDEIKWRDHSQPMGSPLNPVAMPGGGLFSVSAKETAAAIVKAAPYYGTTWRPSFRELVG